MASERAVVFTGLTVSVSITVLSQLNDVRRSCWNVNVPAFCVIALVMLKPQFKYSSPWHTTSVMFVVFV